MRNVDLVVKAVRDPPPDLFRRGAARVQHDVERMMDVIGAALRPQLLLELIAAPGGSLTARSPCHPRQPRRRGARAPPPARESSSSIGLVLLMCIRTLRVAAGSLPTTRACRRPALRQMADITRALPRGAQPDHLIVRPESAIHHYTGSRLHARHTRSSIAPSPGAYTAERPVASSVNQQRNVVPRHRRFRDSESRARAFRAPASLASAPR